MWNKCLLFNMSRQPVSILAIIPIIHIWNVIYYTYIGWNDGLRLQRVFVNKVIDDWNRDSMHFAYQNDENIHRILL